MSTWILVEVLLSVGHRKGVSKIIVIDLSNRVKGLVLLYWLLAKWYFVYNVVYDALAMD